MLVYCSAAARRAIDCNSSCLTRQWVIQDQIPETPRIPVTWHCASTPARCSHVLLHDAVCLLLHCIAAVLVTSGCVLAGMKSMSRCRHVEKRRRANVSRFPADENCIPFPVLPLLSLFLGIFSRFSSDPAARPLCLVLSESISTSRSRYLPRCVHHQQQVTPHARILSRVYC